MKTKDSGRQADPDRDHRQFTITSVPLVHEFLEPTMGRLFWPRRLIVLLLLSGLSCAGYAEPTGDIAFTGTADASDTLAQDQSASTSVNQIQSATKDCKINNHWQKSLVIMPMPRINPSSSNAGNLYQAETKIPRMLAAELSKTIGIRSNFSLLSSRQDLSEDNRRQQIRNLAAQTESQFVLSGEILDMSMRDASTLYSPHILQRLRNHFTDITMMKFADNRDRHFSLQLELRDGFTGELLMTRQFQTSGIWKNLRTTGFDSPELWDSQYGRRIKKLLGDASRELASSIKCQPFITKVESRPGQQDMILQGGTNNGLKTGDQLSPYQLVTLGSDRYESYRTRLIKRDLQVQLREVYPSHSVGRLIGDDLMNGQYLAVGEE